MVGQPAKAPGEVLQGQALQFGALGTAYSPYSYKDWSSGFDPPLTLGAPGSLNSDQAGNGFTVSSAPYHVNAYQLQFVFRNLATGQSGEVSFYPNRDIYTAFVAAIVFNNYEALRGLLAPICGDGASLQVQAYALDSSGAILGNSPALNVTVVRSPCVCTTIGGNFFTNLDSLSGCMGVDGELAVQGRLYENTCGSTIVSPFVNQASVVSVGLRDPATGAYYEYARASTDGMGTFSVGFAVKNRADVAALVPVNGNKAFSLWAFYVGSATHSRSAPFSRGVTVAGNQGPQCPLGTLILDNNYEAVPSTESVVHRITGAYAGKLLALSDQERAADVASKVHDAILGAGAHPVNIKVYRGPNITLPLFYGFGSVSVPGFNVVATAWGSPITVAALAAVLLAVIIILAIFVIALWFVDDIVQRGGGGVLQTGAIAVIVLAGAGLGIYYLSQRKKKR